MRGRDKCALAACRHPLAQLCARVWGSLHHVCGWFGAEGRDLEAWKLMHV